MGRISPIRRHQLQGWWRHLLPSRTKLGSPASVPTTAWTPSCTVGTASQAQACSFTSTFTATHPRGESSCMETISQVWPLHNKELNMFTRLSKVPSDLKQKCTQLPTPFSGTVFNALSHGVIHFVRSVSFKNLEMEVFDWLLKNFNQ